MHRLALITTLALAGCATFSLRPLTDHLASLKGQPVEAAFKQLGYPDRQAIIAGRTVYYWGDGESACQVRVVATPNGLVDSGTIYGSPAGCGRFL